jgi:hypothetical protein
MDRLIETRCPPPATPRLTVLGMHGTAEPRCQLTLNSWLHKLKRLEALPGGVKRAGDFFVQGSLDAPIPRVEIDGVGVLSFPVPASQIEMVIKRLR